jgi:hypothetical protein
VSVISRQELSDHLRILNTSARLNLVLPSNAHESLDLAAKKAQCTKSEFIRRAVALAIYIQENTKSGVSKVSITSNDDKVIKDIILF